jgi:hypothetical protein
MYYNEKNYLDICGNNETFATNWRTDIPGYATAFRVTESGEIGCARRGNGCAWGSYSWNNNTGTLSCGAEHQRHHRITGYNNWGHWCTRVLHWFGYPDRSADRTEFRMVFNNENSYNTNQNFTNNLQVLSSPGYTYTPNSDVNGNDIRCDSQAQIESGSADRSSWKKKYAFSNDTTMTDNTQPGYQAKAIQKMINVAARECTEEYKDTCNGFNVFVDNGVVKRCLKETDSKPVLFDYNDSRFKSIKGIGYFRKNYQGLWEPPLPTDEEKRRLERFTNKESEGILDKIISIPKKLFGGEEKKENFVTMTLPDVGSLYLSVFADDEVQVYTFDKWRNSLSLITTVFFRNRIPVKVRIPNFTNNHVLIFRVRNTGGPGYLVANWEWNGNRYYTDENTVYIPSLSFVDRAPQRQLAATGQYMGCYRDIDMQPALTQRVDSVKSIEECAAKANKLTANNKDSFYGIRFDQNNNAQCFIGNQLYGCNNRDLRNEGKNHDRCWRTSPWWVGGLRNGDLVQYAGGESQQSMAVYKLRESGDYVKTPVEVYNYNEVASNFHSNLQNHIDIAKAKFLKVQMTNYKDSRNNIGFTRATHFGNNVGLDWGAGFREFVWEPKSRSLTMEKEKICGIVKHENYNANQFYDAENPATENLRDPSVYQIDNKTCTGRIIDDSNLMESANRNIVIGIITNRLPYYLQTSMSYTDFTYLTDLRYKVRMDQDANIMCVTGADGRCKTYNSETEANRESNNNNTIKCPKYTTDSWCVDALQSESLYGAGREHLRYSIKYGRALFRLLKIMMADIDVQKIIKDTENSVDFSEYETLTSFESLVKKTDENMSRYNDTLQILQSRIQTLIGFIYDHSKPRVETDENGRQVTLPARIDITKQTQVKDTNISGSIFVALSDLYKISRSMDDMDI